MLEHIHALSIRWSHLDKNKKHQSIRSDCEQIITWKRVCGSMYHLGALYILALMWTAAVEIVAAKDITSCCSERSSLVKLNAKVNCRNPKSAERVLTNDETIGESEPAQGYRIGKPIYRNRTSVRQCAHQVMAFYSEEHFELSEESCLAVLDKRIVAISCFLDQAERPLQKVSVIHKCCPMNYIYDALRQRCALQDRSFDAYSVFFQHPAVFLSSPVDCPKHKVLVEYKLPAEMLFFVEGKLVLRNLNTNFGFRDYCIESVVNESRVSEPVQLFLVRTCEDIASCDRMPCIRRCCSDDQMFSKGNATSYCAKDSHEIFYHSFESLEISGNFSKPGVFGILKSLDCLKFRLDPDSYPEEAHTISNRDGSLYVMNSQKKYFNNQYCIEKIHNSTSGDQKLYTFICFDTKVVGNDKIRFKLYPIGLLISCSFYALTLLIYLSISRLRNLPGKILICLVISLFSAYLAIALGQLMPTSNDDICFASGFLVYFCLIAAFAWMNVMCFDIWQTFGTAKRNHSFRKEETKRFLLYSAYGWGLPTLFTFVTILFTKLNVLSETIRPQFGHGRCWFRYDTFASANLVFFSGPVGVLFLINFVLFSLTLRYCNKVKREIFRMQSSNMEKPALRRRFFMDKARFAMNTKLFIVMGITWFLELLSILLYDHKKTFFWAISDSFNVLLGVFVFFIFVFKKRVWHSVLEKFGLRSRDTVKSTPRSTFANTHSTCAQSASMTRLNAIDANLLLLSPIAAARKSSNS